MKVKPVTLLLLIVFLYPLLKGFVQKFSSNNYKKSVGSIGGDIAFIIALFLGSNFSRKLFLEHDRGIYKRLYGNIPTEITNYVQSNNLILYLIVIPLSIYIVYKLLSKVLYLIFICTLFPILDIIETRLKTRSEGFKRVLGVMFQIPRAIAYILVVSFVLNVYSNFNQDNHVNVYLQQSKLYNKVCTEVVIPITKSTLAKKLPNIINDSFKIQTKDGWQHNPVVYYNGVTLEEGVKSNKNIDDFAKQLLTKQNSTLNKSKTVYNWIGRNLEYDSEKANEVLNNNFNKGSGAIPAFESRKGICFDYACLYVAMCRASGVKVRLITGYGFNGVSWVGHAWNQVYYTEENRWINVDCTFYKGGNYFDTVRFDMDHKKAEIAGEW